MEPVAGLTWLGDFELRRLSADYLDGYTSYFAEERGRRRTANLRLVEYSPNRISGMDLVVDQ